MKSRLTPNCCVDGRFGLLGLSGLGSDTREPYFFTCCSSWLKKSSTKQMLVKMKLQIFTANPFTLCAVVQLKILCRYMLHFQRKRGRSHKKGPTDQITTCLIFKSMLPHLLRMPKYEPKKSTTLKSFLRTFEELLEDCCQFKRWKCKVNAFSHN